MMKSRAKIIWTVVYFLISCLLGVVCVINHVWILLRLLVYAMVVVGIFMIGDAVRCPFCKEYGLKLRPLSKDAGLCKKCGQLVKYEED